jgi:hypothetical protein
MEEQNFFKLDMKLTINFDLVSLLFSVMTTLHNVKIMIHNGSLFL